MIESYKLVEENLEEMILTTKEVFMHQFNNWRI